MGSSFCNNCGAENKVGATLCWACGEALGASSPPAQNSSLTPDALLHGRYRLSKQLGSGGFGAVYQALDTNLHDRIVAIKQIRIRGLTEGEAEEATKSFRSEVQLLASLKHPGLPAIFEEFEGEDSHYLVMDFIEGETLEEYVTHTGGKLPVPTALALALQLCEILDYLHTRHPPVIFRDLKPANVMCTDQGHLYLIDFGIARHFKPGQLKDTIAFGSPGYAAPEQYGRAQTTPRADIYSLGALLHFLLTGHDPSLQPFHFTHLPSKLAGNASLDELIQRMVAMDEAQRPASVKEVKQQLETIQAEIAEQPRALQPRTLPKKQLPARKGYSQGKRTRQNASRQKQQQVYVQAQAPLANNAGRRKPTRRHFLIGGLLAGGLVAGGATLLALRARNSPGQDASAPEVVTVYWAPAGNLVAFCWDDGRVSLLNAQSETFLYSFNLSRDKLAMQVCWSPDSKQLALYDATTTPPRIWDVELRKVVLTYPANADLPISANTSPSEAGMVWSPDGRYLAWGGLNLDVWSATGLDNLCSLPLTTATQGHNVSIDSLTWAGDSKYLAMALLNFDTSDVTEIQIINTQSQQQIGNLTLPKGPNTSVLMRWAPVGDYIAVYKGTNLHLLNPADSSKNILVRQNFDPYSVIDLAWSADGEFLALASYSGFWVYAMRTQQLFSYDSAGQYAGLIWLSPGRIALVSDAGQVRITQVPQAAPTASPSAKAQ